MELAENPKSVITCDEENGSEEAVVSDQTNRFQYKTKLDSFIIDMDSFSNSSSNEISRNFRIIRNFSRKGMLRGGNKMGQGHGDGDDTGGDSISPLGGVVGGGSSTVEKQAVGMGEEVGGVGGNVGSGRASFRRNSLKRCPQSWRWYLDPRMVFLLCATLSCVGTVLLIYLTFSRGLMKEGESELE
ncbi:uncharacterized protein LOC111804055 isoform X2 [Cucurbita pepo subsp. pepo]|uniref:uncharacterized protein LOC111804055 isoform X2 n=1 Tax=Cucurbita pepo subsp. pepo TaxID=3664 RepID=UPI000C9D7FA8|nr:uncharacterized protein LOC111804055 isoform X2 [Cucurbita pepo subsp. pepo]